MAQAAVFAWSYSVYPQTVLPNDRWRRLFHLAGYVEDYDQVSAPKAPMTLYRGHLEAHKANWSWTGSLDAAKKWASEIGPDAKIWTIDVASDALFGHFTERNEDEYIVDPAGLPIAVAE